MAGVRALLERVRKLEQARVSPWVRWIGTPEQFSAEVRAGIDAGNYDPRDMPVVLNSVCRWIEDQRQYRFYFKTIFSIIVVTIASQRRGISQPARSKMKKRALHVVKCMNETALAFLASIFFLKMQQARTARIAATDARAVSGKREQAAIRAVLATGKLRFAPILLAA